MFKQYLERALNSRRFFYVTAFSILFTLLPAVYDAFDLRGLEYYFQIGPSWDLFCIDNQPIFSITSYTYQLMEIIGYYLLVPMTLVSTFYDDWKSNYSNLIFTRQKKLSYFWQGLFLAFLGSFLLTFVSIVTFRTFQAIVYPYEPRGADFLLGDSYDLDYAFESEPSKKNTYIYSKLPYTNMYLYFFVVTIRFSNLFGMVAAITYAYTMSKPKNRLVAVWLPSLLFLFADTILEILSKSSISYPVLFDENLNNTGRQPIYFCILLLILIILIVSLFIHGLKKNEDIL